MTRRRAHATTGQLVRSARNLKILAAIDSGVASQAEIARHFDLSPAQVSRIRSAMLGNSSSGRYRETGDEPAGRAGGKATPGIFLHPPRQALGPHPPRKR